MANDWIWTWDLWCRKQLLCQMSHNYGPIDVFTKKKAFGFNFIIVFVIGNNEQTFGEHFYLISAKISLFDICIQSFLYTLVSIVLYSNK